jgi:hypothetical protein
MLVEFNFKEQAQKDINSSKNENICMEVRRQIFVRDRQLKKNSDLVSYNVLLCNYLNKLFYHETFMVVQTKFKGAATKGHEY